MPGIPVNASDYVQHDGIGTAITAAATISRNATTAAVAAAAAATTTAIATAITEASEASATKIAAARPVRLTTLCILRFCLGYRVPILSAIPPQIGSTTTPDLLSASIVISGAFLAICLLATIIVLLIEAVCRSHLQYMLPGLGVYSVRSEVNRRIRGEHVISVTPVALYDHLSQVSPLIASGNTGCVCSICLDDFTPPAVIRRLRCSHAFHGECIDRWLLHSLSDPSMGVRVRPVGSEYRSGRRGEERASRPACPVCKTPVFHCFAQKQMSSRVEYP